MKAYAEVAGLGQPGLGPLARPLPWILGFSGTSSATWNAVILGLLVGLLALSVAREKPKTA